MTTMEDDRIISLVETSSPGIERMQRPLTMPFRESDRVQVTLSSSENTLFVGRMMPFVWESQMVSQTQEVK